MSNNELASVNHSENQVDEYRGMLQKLIEMGMNQSQEIVGIKNDVSGLNRRMDKYEFEEEITYEMQNTIDREVSKRVYAVLGLNPYPSRWSEEECLEYAKYGRTFRRRLRSEVSNKGHLAYPYKTTRKGNFDASIKDIEAWTPRIGIDGLKREIDMKAEAKRKAKEQGYE